MLNVNKTDLLRHHTPETLSDRFAATAERLLTATVGALFGRRYGDQVIVLETIACADACRPKHAISGSNTRPAPAATSFTVNSSAGDLTAWYARPR